MSDVNPMKPVFPKFPDGVHVVPLVDSEGIKIGIAKVLGVNSKCTCGTKLWMYAFNRVR